MMHHVCTLNLYITQDYMLNKNARGETRELVERLRWKDEKRILFVCLGNICRSPVADGLMQALLKEKGATGWVVDSAGTGGYHLGDLPDNRMRVHARKRGYELTHRARKVREADFEDFDMIVAMDGSNYQNLRRMAPTIESEAKIVPMIDFVTLATRCDHIPDPYYEGSEGFELVLDLLENGVANLYESLA